jgi:hypothetical protein
LDGRTGTTAAYEKRSTPLPAEAYCAKIEQAAKAADPTCAPDRCSD